MGVEVQRVVNCTGPALGFEGVAHLLVRSLLDSGTATLDPLRPGFATSDAERLVNRDGQASSWLFGIGPMRRGELFESIAVPEIRAEAAHVADVFVKELDLTAFE